MTFSDDFIWGTATSAYQIEGAAKEDGKGESIWDAYCKEGKIWEGHTGDIACDHYHHIKEDVELMSKLGIQAYRFSVAWTRILPHGTGEVNDKGIDFYMQLIDELIAHNITPYMTLFHWDYPYELEMKGGWLNEDSPRWFEEYTGILAKVYGDKVKHFITFNEPQIFMGLGYDECKHAPGIKYPRRRLLQMAHNIALAHNLAVKKLRFIVKDPKIGYAPTCGNAYYPATDNAKDVEVAAIMNNSFDENNWIYSSAFWNDLIIKGRYHPLCYEKMPQDMKYIKSDADITGEKLDFCGMNIYQGIEIASDASGHAVIKQQLVGHPKTGMGWSITPEAMYWVPKYFYDRYHIPIIITENGISNLDVLSLDGKIHDPLRIDYIHRHLKKLANAIEAGCDIQGYFYWSFMDNFEWEKGYDDRFGLVYVDYSNMQRLCKDSFEWYANIVKSKGTLL